MSIPLVQNNEKDSINTSIIAIKRNIERINMLLGLSNSEEIDTSEFVKKSDIVDVVEAGNMNPVTSNAVVPVDEVTSGNMQSVTSNAVAVANSYSTTEQKTGGVWIDGKPIYRKVWVLSSPISLSVNTWATLSEVVITNAKSIVTVKLQGEYPCDFNCTISYKYGNCLRVLSPQTWAVSLVILEYTKTTD